MQIGFIGCGNMAKPMILGAADARLAPPASIWVTDINTDALASFCADAGVRAADRESLVRACDVIVLAVKPQVLPELLPQIAAEVNRRRPLVISIAAGKTTAYIGSFFDDAVPVARIFPNLNAKVKAAVSAYCGNKNVSALQMETLKQICESFGAAFAIPEDKMNIFGVLGGCAPAYTFMYIDALATAAERAGFDRAGASEIAAKMAEGSAKLLAAADESAAELVKKVCSPGGTTIEGVNSLSADRFADCVENAFQASLRRDAELAK